MTVTLSNYDISADSHDVRKWITSVQYGSGKGFPTFIVPGDYHLKIEPIVRTIEKGRRVSRRYRKWVFKEDRRRQ